MVVNNRLVASPGTRPQVDGRAPPFLDQLPKALSAVSGVDVRPTLKRCTLGSQPPLGLLLRPKRPLVLAPRAVGRVVVARTPHDPTIPLPSRDTHGTSTATD